MQNEIMLSGSVSPFGVASDEPVVSLATRQTIIAKLSVSKQPVVTKPLSWATSIWKVEMSWVYAGCREAQIVLETEECGLDAQPF